MPVNKCHHTSQVSQVCSGVLKGLWLACPAVKNGCEKSQMLTAAVREQLIEGIRQLLFRDSHAMLLYRCSWNVIHEGLKAEKPSVLEMRHQNNPGSAGVPPIIPTVALPPFGNPAVHCFSLDSTGVSTSRWPRWPWS